MIDVKFEHFFIPVVYELVFLFLQFFVLLAIFNHILTIFVALFSYQIDEMYRSQYFIAKLPVIELEIFGFQPIIQTHKKIANIVMFVFFIALLFYILIVGVQFVHEIFLQLQIYINVVSRFYEESDLICLLCKARVGVLQKEESLFNIISMVIMPVAHKKHRKHLL